MEANNIQITSEKEKSNNTSNPQSIDSYKINKLQQSNTNNTTENINLNDNNNNNNKSSLNILNFINEMPFENLNDYYDIESSLFLKRIEKLNLKFFWTSESILNQQDIKYPFNKLFLILFKQISLYIEEIARLNKQLRLKNKNEKYYQIKIAQMKQKEKENILNKQMLKNLQRDNKLLEKRNEKNKNEIDKLNKKIINTYKTLNYNIINNTTTNAMHINKNNFILGSPKTVKKTGYGSLITHKSPISVKSNIYSDFSDMSDDYSKYANIIINKNNKKEKISSKSIDDSYINKKNKNSLGDIINQGIIQCAQEIENLELIEEILNEFKNKNNNNKNYRNESSNNIIGRNHINLNGINNSKKKKEKVSNKTNIPIKKYIHNYHKSYDFSKK